MSTGAAAADPAATRDLLLELIDAGTTHLVLAPVTPWPDRPAQWLADEIGHPGSDREDRVGIGQQIR